MRAATLGGPAAAGRARIVLRRGAGAGSGAGLDPAHRGRHGPGPAGDIDSEWRGRRGRGREGGGGRRGRRTGPGRRHSGRPMKEDMSIEFIDFISVCSPLIPPICHRDTERESASVCARHHTFPDGPLRHTRRQPSHDDSAQRLRLVDPDSDSDGRCYPSATTHDAHATARPRARGAPPHAHRTESRGRATPLHAGRGPRVEARPRPPLGGPVLGRRRSPAPEASGRPAIRPV